LAWLAAAAHEIPQELGDFGVLVHSGWEKRKALMFNVLSAPTFLVGGLLTYLLQPGTVAKRQVQSQETSITWL
jgi:zinc and cadmium transporter